MEQRKKPKLKEKRKLHTHPVGDTVSRADASFGRTAAALPGDGFSFSLLTNHTHLVGAAVSEVGASFGRTTAALFRDGSLNKFGENHHE